MLDRAAYVPDRDLSGVRVLEPAAGDGAFAAAIVDRLYESALRFGFSFQQALHNLTCFEVDAQMADALTRRLTDRLSRYGAVLPDGMIRRADFLLAEIGLSYDLIVGNPPYVRHEQIPVPLRQLYRDLYPVFTHRSDLYIAFYERSLRLLSECGLLCFICSNRWLKNQYGQRLRELIGRVYGLGEVIDLEDADPFEESVAAYPAITSVYKSKSRSKSIASYYKVHHVSELDAAAPPLEPVRPLDIQHPSNWFSAREDPAHSGMLYTIEEQGFNIGIGVATGADVCYIRPDLASMVEPELCLPILLSKDLKNNQLVWSGNYLLNPFDLNGRLIDLECYPRARAYFGTHSELLRSRYVARKSPEAWYRTIDRVDAALVGRNKLMLPDMSGNTFLLIDEGRYYPHHNLYYITGGTYDDLVLLACILMSRFVKDQLAALGNRMNGGYLRWQSQHVKKLRIPHIRSIPAHIARELADAYHRREYHAIDRWLSGAAIAQYGAPFHQTTLF
ncbi:MAG: Eco57I restriction-modification methylase domain-containing protein [Bacteroidia bacterium]|nr:Eco57I restriction-modification methylase domain-containing protein [Bacteroidia bacterium]